MKVELIILYKNSIQIDQKIDFNKKLYSGRMHYISPIIFFSRRKEDSNNNK